METRKTLSTFFDSKQLPEAKINKYEENIDFFNKLIETGNTQDKEFALNIKIINYINEMYHFGQYKKALKVIDQTEKELFKLKSTSKLYSTFRDSLTFNKGICLGRLKKYRESNIEIKKLLQKKPDNDIYLGWFEGNNTEIFRKHCNAIAVFGGVLYAMILFLDGDQQIVQNTIIRRSGLILMLLSLALHYFAPKIIKKRSK